MNQKSEVGAPKAEGRKRRNDVIFTAALLVLLILAGLAFYLLRGEGDTVVVTVVKGVMNFKVKKVSRAKD